MKKKAKYRLIKLISAMSLLVVIIVSISFAWFKETNEPIVTDITVNIIKANDLAISVDGIDWKRLIQDEDENYQLFKSISGNGTDFYYPNYQYVSTPDANNKYIDIEEKITSYTLIDETELKDYLYVQDIFFHADSDVRLFFTDKTCILPNETNGKILADGTTSTNYIAGAIRFGFAIKEEGEYVTKFVWIPNTKYELKLVNNIYSVDRNGTVEDEYTFVNGTQLEDVITINTGNYVAGYVTMDGIKYFWGDITKNEIICEIPRGDTEVRFTIWVEGSDREANSVLSGGFIHAILDFESEIIE